MTESNMAKWGQIKEIEAREIKRAVRSKWRPLFDELCLRLEQTAPRYALLVPFETYKEAERAYAAIWRYFCREKGKDSVCMGIRKGENRTICLYVFRGKNWR